MCLVLDIDVSAPVVVARKHTTVEIGAACMMTDATGSKVETSVSVSAKKVQARADLSGVNAKGKQRQK